MCSISGYRRAQGVLRVYVALVVVVVRKDVVICVLK
jgi:hypothetical protein